MSASCLRSSTDLRPRESTETKNTYHLADPSFTYLLSAFQLLTGIAWGIATQGRAGPTLRLTLMFIFVHFLLSSLVIATLAFLLIGRLLGPGGKGLPSRMRRRGLFGEEGGGRNGEAEDLEFGYCFDVAIRAFFPVWICLYVGQFVLWFLIRGDHWISLFLGNTLYLVAFSYYVIIFFLGYNALPFLQHTELLLSPIILYAILPSSPPPRRKHSDSPSPRTHKRSRRRPNPSPSPLPKTKRSNQPLPSQNDAYKGTSTALVKPSNTSPAPSPSKQKPNYAPSGLLAAETNTVANTSIVLKYHEPPDSRLPPPSQPYLLYIFKSSDLLSKLTLNERSCWLFGREKIVADVPVEHPSASKQHAVLQFRHVVRKDEFGEKRGGVGLYMLDLDSANGSFLNGERVEGRRYVEVRHGDVLMWGESSREYVVLVPPKEMVAK
ncbi:MAG: hypothetical protein Q9192_004820 [Flavoplaca navasiana]